jgi:hypothetical protein
MGLIPEDQADCLQMGLATRIFKVSETPTAACAAVA